MSIFNILGEVSKVIGDKTGEFVESNRLNSKIKEERLELEKLYATLGKHVKAHESKLNVLMTDEIMRSYFEEIDRKQNLINRLEEELITSKEAHNGQVQQSQVQQPMSDGKYCTSCGTLNSLDSKFCEGCGQRMDEAVLRHEESHEREACDNSDTDILAEESIPGTAVQNGRQVKCNDGQ